LITKYIINTYSFLVPLNILLPSSSFPFSRENQILNNFKPKIKNSSKKPPKPPKIPKKSFTNKKP
jgi:hypothetical protein